MVDRFAIDWTTAGLDGPTTALLAYVEKLTREPAKCDGSDIDALRAADLSDRAINDVVQVCAYFNYINSIADALGVLPEEWLDEAGRPV
jgi:uncharacterized peroxidase-related enzyme